MKIKTFRNFLSENSLYTSQTEYNNLVADKKKSAKIFLTSFVGTVVLYGLDHTKPVMTKYIKSEGSVRLSNMKDDNNDMSLAVKIASDAGVIRSTKAREITKFLYLIKTRKIKDINKDALRSMINEPLLVINLPGRYKSEFSSYIEGKQTLEQVFYNLKNVILSDDDIGAEFKTLFKRYRSELSVNVKGSVDDDVDDKQSVVNSVDKVDKADDKVSVIDKEEPKTKIDTEVEKAAVKKSLEDTGGTPPQLNPYDLTLRKNINEHFIKMLSQPDPNTYLKSIGSGLTKFPWEKLVPIDAEVAKAFYRNRDTHNIKEPYLNKIMTKKRAKFQSMYANDISHLMSIKGFNILFEEGSLSIDEYIDNAKVLQIPIDYKLIAKRSPKDDINFVLRLDQKLGEYGSTISNSYKDLFTSPPNSFAQLIIDDFKNIDRDLMLYANIHVMISYHKDLYRVNDNSIESLNKTYMQANHDKQSLYNLFRDDFEKYYDFLEENDFFNHSDLKKYKVNEVTLKTESDIYNFYKGKSLDLLPDSTTASTFINYIIDNKVYNDFVQSNPRLSSMISINYLFNNYGSVFNELKKAYDKDTDNNIKKSISILNKDIENELVYIYLEQNSSELFGDVDFSKIGILSEIAKHTRGVSVYKELTKKYGDPNISFDLLSDKYVYDGLYSIVVNLGINLDITSKAEQFLDFYGDEIMKLLINMDNSNLYSLTPLEFLFKNKINSAQFNDLKKDVVLGIVKKYNESEFRELVEAVFSSIRYIRNRNLHEILLSVFKEVSPIYYNIIMQKIISVKNPGVVEVINLINSDLPFEDYVGHLPTELIVRTYSENTDNNKLLELLFAKLDIVSDKIEIKAALNYSLLYAKEGAIILNSLYKKDPEYLKEIVKNLINSNTTDTTNISRIIEKVYSTENSDLMGLVSDTFVDVVRRISTKDIKEMFTYHYDTLLDVVLYSDKHASGVIDNLKSPTYSRRILESAATKLAISKSNIRDSLYNDSNIKPLVEMDDGRLTKVLEYNDIKIKLSSVRRKKGEETSAYIKRISETSNDVNFSAVEVENRSLSSEQLKRMTIEYEAFNSGNHGDTAIEFIESFNVSDSITKNEFYEFREKYSDTTMYPVFHGTGSVAASMILRFGYSVIDPNDESAVGRMLGNGIYFSNVIDKVAQYIGDSGYSRKKGTIGYIFEMDANLGIKDTHYKSAGVDSSDGIRSPEWCVFDPAAQLSIKYAHKVRLISTQRINELRAEILGESARKNHATPILEFSSWLKTPKRQKMIKEQLVKEKYQYAVTFMFNDGMIPVSKDRVIHFSQIKDEFSDKDNVYIESSAKGVSVIILYNDSDMFYNDTYIVKGAEEWLLSTDEVKTAYIEALGE